MRFSNLITYWAAIINEVTAALVTCLIMPLASRSKVMVELTLPVYFKLLGWVRSAIMVFAAVAWFLRPGNSIGTSPGLARALKQQSATLYLLRHTQKVR